MIILNKVVNAANLLSKNMQRIYHSFLNVRLYILSKT